MENDKIIGLILTAGYSSRMGTFKPLLQIGDMTAIERVAGSLKKAGINRIVGVTGFQREGLHSIFEREGIVEAYNQDYAQGMFTSIKQGIAKTLSESFLTTDALGEPLATPDGFLLMLVDCPLIPPEVIKQIIEKHEENPEAFIVPCFRGKKGHPLFIPSRYAQEILSHDGEGGLKAITNRYEDQLIRLEVNTESVVLDMDTPEGYEEVLEYYHSQRKEDYNRRGKEGGGSGTVKTGIAEEPDFEKLLQGKRLFLIRHGEIRQHSEKIFLGQTDIPLSERGREQAREAAAELVKYNVSVSRMYTSDLSRARQTAEIIREKLIQSLIKHQREIRLINEPRLREMSLGDWDGRVISEIKEEFPEEYRKRGENLLTYKFGNDSENFYDLQYRVMKGFRNIVKREREAGDDEKDILIVSHRGVINGILASLQQTELGEQIANPLPNGGMIMMDYTDQKVIESE